MKWFGPHPFPIKRQVQIWYDEFDWPNEQLTGWLAGTRLCDKMLTRHREAFEKLVHEEFDTVVVDDLYNPCGLLLAGLKGKETEI